jgi:TonB family protein
MKNLFIIIVRVSCRQLSKIMTVVGVCLGLVTLTACESKTKPANSIRDSLSIESQITGFQGSVSDTLSAVIMGVECQPHICYDENFASFPGGNEALLKYLSENIKYPQQAKKDSIQGRVVVGFIVEADGSITNPEITRSVHPLLDAEALQIVNQMPKWKPATKYGSKVKTKCFIPVSFKMD